MRGLGDVWFAVRRLAPALAWRCAGWLRNFAHHNVSLSSSSPPNRRVIDSDSDGELDGADDLEEEEPAAAERALPPFFAAIPSLRDGGLGVAELPRQQQPAAPPPRQSTQQHAAPPPATQQRGAPGDRPPPQSASAFKKQREELTAQLFQEFNRTVFEGEAWSGCMARTARDMPGIGASRVGLLAAGCLLPARSCCAACSSCCFSAYRKPWPCRLPCCSAPQASCRVTWRSGGTRAC